MVREEVTIKVAYLQKTKMSQEITIEKQQSKKFEFTIQTNSQRPVPTSEPTQTQEPAQTQTRPPPSSSKIVIDKVNKDESKGGLLFDLVMSKMSEPKVEEQPKQPEGPFKVEFAKKGDLNIERAGRYYPREEFAALDEIDDNFRPKFTRESIGYISLMNYLKEQESAKQGNKGKQSMRRPLKPAAATLVEKDENRYIPATQLKVANVWRDDSREAFEASLNFLLNRLTETRIEKTIEELMSHIKNTTHKNIVSETLVEKAEKEHAFSMIYAKLTSELKDKELKDLIIRNAEKDVDDFITNKPRNENEENRATGTAKFVASMIFHKIIDVEKGLEHLRSILDAIDVTADKESDKTADKESDKTADKTIEACYVEMLEVFIKTAGQSFCRQIKKEDWDVFDAILKHEGPSTRKGCLLLNIKELKDEWLHDKKTNAVTFIPSKDTDELDDYIRSAYCDFTEGTELKDCTAELTQFLYAALKQLPDHIKDAHDYGLFIATVLMKGKQNKNQDRNEVLKRFAIEITENGLISESPKIWNAFFVVIVALYTMAQFQLNKVREIYEKFPEGRDEVNWVNESKFFLYQYYSFTKSVNNKSIPNAEISDALRMPDDIEKRNEHSKFSRLIAIAICRVIVDKGFRVEPEKIGDLIAKYSSQLKVIIEKYTPVFEEEFDAAYEDGFPMSTKEIADKVHAKY